MFRDDPQKPESLEAGQMAPASPPPLAEAFHPLDPEQPLPEWMDERFLTGRADAARHQLTPHITCSDYAWEKRIVISKHALGRRRIYLDQNYWIYCRDAAAGRARKSSHSLLWQRLLELVRSGCALCPLSSVAVLETFKQSDASSRLATAAVMDELSGAVAIRDTQSIRAAEFRHVLRLLNGQPSQIQPKDEIWTAPGLCFGELTHHDDDPNGRARCKAMVDLLSRMRFPDVVRAMPQLVKASYLDDSAVIQRQNEISAAKAAGRSPFETMFLAEARVYMCHIEEALADELQGGLPFRPNVTSPERSELARKLAVAFCERVLSAVRSRDFRTHFPGLHISCSIYAGIDFKQWRFKKGDRYDHLHAQSALPHCDLFLTERSLCSLLTEKPLALDKAYGCEVIWQEDEAIAALGALT